MFFFYIIISLSSFFLINPNFNNWELSGGIGGIIDDSTFYLEGTGQSNNSNYFKYSDFDFENSTFYQINFEYKTNINSGEGCVISGHNLANYDLELNSYWQRIQYIFKTPDSTLNSFIRLGQWEINGSVWFKNFKIDEVSPIYLKYQNMELSSGEMIISDEYSAYIMNNGKSINGSRFLEDYNAFFNTNRWMFFGEKYLIFSHDLFDQKILEAEITISLGWFEKGECIVEISSNKEDWTQLGKILNISTKIYIIPSDFLPLNKIYVRIRSLDSNNSFIVHDYFFKAKIDCNMNAIFGNTLYLQEIYNEYENMFKISSFGNYFNPHDRFVTIECSDFIDEPLDVHIKTHNENGQEASIQTEITNFDFTNNVIKLKYELIGSGLNTVDILIIEIQDTIYHVRTNINLPVIYDNNFGYFLKNTNSIILWWCEPEYKIGQNRLLPDCSSYKPITIYASKNEYQPFQLVINPKNNIDFMSLEVSNFISKNGDTINNDNIELFQVDYIPVLIPSDKEGSPGFWPDPLIPYEDIYNLESELNYPIWFSIYIPKNTQAGLYNGQINLNTKFTEIIIPIDIYVWDFQLSDIRHLKTSFNIDKEILKIYHHISSDEQMDSILKLYYDNLSKHRISPFNSLSDIEFEIKGIGWQGGFFDSSESFKGSVSYCVLDSLLQRSVAGITIDYIPIYKEYNYIIEWAVKTEVIDQKYLVSLNFFDSSFSWIPRKNIDIKKEGENEWESNSFYVDSDKIPLNAEYVKLFLRPVLWSEQGELVGKAWFDCISFKRQDVAENLIVNGDFENHIRDLFLEFDFAEFDKSLNIALNKYFFNCFRLNITGFSWGTFQSKHLGEFSGFNQGSEEYNIIYSKYLKGIQDHLNELGVIDLFYIYWFDEPNIKDYEFVKYWMGFIHNSAPLLKRFLTEEPVSELFGSVDIWCPLLSDFDSLSACGRQEFDEEIWWYISTIPKSPYCTQFIDHNGIELRIWIWHAWRYSIDGINHWKINYWSSYLIDTASVFQDPYNDPMSYVKGYGFPKGYISYWGNGDGRLLYPPKQCFESEETCLDGPVNSIRWELLRDGIEDYEYFWILDSILQERKLQGLWNRDIQQAEYLLDIPDSIIYNFIEYTKNPVILNQYRYNLGSMIQIIK